MIVLKFLFFVFWWSIFRYNMPLNVWSLFQFYCFIICLSRILDLILLYLFYDLLNFYQPLCGSFRYAWLIERGFLAQCG